MCGRYGQEMSWSEIHAFSQPLIIRAPSEELVPSWNIAPTTLGWVITAGDRTALAQNMRWGLVPAWSKDRKRASSMINARSESAAEKPAFRSAWRERRCLVPASGYYEWPTSAAGKQPYWIYSELGMMMFAGLWERWRQPDGEWLLTYSILTTEALGDISQLHDRTPVMLDAAVFSDWLHGDAQSASAIVARLQLPPLHWHAVNPAVGNVRNNGADLISAVAPIGDLLSQPQNRSAKESAKLTKIAE